MVVINIFGGPGTGKSTCATWLAAELKSSNYSIELVTEYIKKWAWMKLAPQSWDGLYVFAKQLQSVDVITRNNVSVVSDSPLLMQLAYLEGTPYYKELTKIVRTFESQFPILNFYLLRKVPYVEAGRYQNLGEAIVMDQKILSLLEENNVRYKTVDPRFGRDEMLLHCIEALK